KIIARERKSTGDENCIRQRSGTRETRRRDGRLAHGARGAVTDMAEMMAAAVGPWGPGQASMGFKDERMVEEDDHSDTTSQSLESREPESLSSNGDETEASEVLSEPRRLRATLSKEQAAVIYVLRPPQKDHPYPRHVAAGNSQLLSKWFGVSPKAVRDVWNRRTWAHATGKHVPESVLDALPMMMEQQAKARSARRERPAVVKEGVVVRPPGRPIGSKDMKPRRRRVAMKAPDNFVLDNRIPQNGMQTGMSRDDVHAAMFTTLNAELIPPIELMEERGGSQSEPPGFSDGSSHSPPSESGDALDYLSGARWHAASGGSASAASMAASAHAQQLAAAAWNMYEVPSPDGQDRERRGSSPDTRNFPFFLSPQEAAAAEAAAHLHQYQQQQLQQQHHQHQQQHRHQQHQHEHGASAASTRVASHAKLDGYSDHSGSATAGRAPGIEAWRASMGAGGQSGEEAQWEQWARYAQWKRNGSPPQRMPGQQYGVPARAGDGGYPGYPLGGGGGGQMGAYGLGFGAW
ncbi:hypothetical protein T484DRAFT_2995142, partial [Baffinella frigidus]